MHIVFSILFLVLFLAPKYVAPAILVIVIYTIVQAVRGKFTFQYSHWFLLLPALFVMYSIGCLYTQNTEAIAFELESRLSFIVFPLIFLWIPYDQKSLRKTGRLYVLIALISSVFCLLSALSCEVEFGYGGYCYFKKFIAYKLHTTYISFYYLFAVLLMNYFRIIKKPLFNWSIEIFASITLLVFIVFFTSKAVYLSVILYFFILFLLLFKQLLGPKTRWVSVFLFLGIILTLIFTPNPVKSKLLTSYEAFQEFQHNKTEFLDKHKGKIESSASRLVVWVITWEEIKKNPLGVGTADIKPHLIRQYKKEGFFKLAEKELNPHNQFLQTGLAIGIQGVLLLLIIFIVPMVKALQGHRYLFFAFLLLFAFNCFFESMLEVQAGIVFFSFVFSWLLKGWVSSIQKPEHAQ